MNSCPRVALVGCGWFACAAHIPALRRLEAEGALEIVAICSRSEESLARAGDKLGRVNAKRYKSLDDLLSVPDLDVVDLVLPISAMPSAVRKSLQAGKHVISEKPCAPTVAEGLDLIDYHGRLESRRLWAVAENWRFKRSVKIIDEIVKRGALGVIRFADFRYMTYTGPADLGWRGTPDYPGGFLIDSGVHFVALLRQTIGDVAQVSATVTQRLPHLPPADSVTAILTFAGGGEGYFRLSFAGQEADSQPGLTIVGSRGMLLADFRRNTIEVVESGRRRFIRVRNDLWVTGGVYDVLAHSIDAVQTGAPLRSNALEGLYDVAVIEAMLLSSKTSQPVRPSFLHSVLKESSPNLKTYDRVHTFKPTRVVDCASVEDVRLAVTDAVSAGMHVRTMGNGYSWAPHLLTRDVCLRSGGLNRIVGLDKVNKTIRVEAGVRLGDLTRHLAAHGLSLPSLSFVSDATIGGAVATGTHGTSPKWGTLSDFVRSLTLVLSSGEVKTVDQNSSPEELRAAKVAVGMLGVIVELELQAIDMPWVRYSERTMTLLSFLAERSRILTEYDHVWGHWLLGRDKVLVKRLEVRAGPTKGFWPYVTDDNAHWDDRKLLARGSRRIKSALHRIVPSLSYSLGGQSDGQLSTFRQDVWMSMQYAVSASQTEAAIDRIRTSEFAAANAGRVVELKFLRGTDQTYLGANADADASLFNLWWLVDDRFKFDAFRSFEATMKDLRARPHWGKFHSVPSLEYLRAAYPHWAEFEKVRSKFDPSKTFSIFNIG